MAFQYQPGIYKTTKFLPGHEATVAPNMLVLIRTDAEFAPASVLLPVSNVQNQWRFQMPGVRVPASSFGWGDSLIKLPHEGFYRLKEQLTFGDSGRWLVNAIVQLGYTKGGDPILFIAQRRNPLASNGSQVRFCSAVPNIEIGCGTPIDWSGVPVEDHTLYVTDLVERIRRGDFPPPSE